MKESKDTIMRVMIVDDESHARESLKRALTSYDGIDIIGECENGIQAIKLCQEHQPEVMFLDIQMPKLDGFDVLDLLGDDAPIIVFVTAHDDYAIQAFEANAIDYLLKPVNTTRLGSTIQRLRARLTQASKATHQQKNQNLVEKNQQIQAPLQRILIRDKSEVHVIPVEDIMCVEAADDYVVFHTEKDNYVKQDRLQKLAANLDPQTFCRIHRSSIINVQYLTGIETENDQKIAVLKNNFRLAISRSGYKSLVKTLT